MRRNGVLALASAWLLGLGAASAAHGASVTLGFKHIVEAGDGSQQLGDGATGEAQFSVVISDTSDPNKVSFKFLNTLASNPLLADSNVRIDGVYFDDGTLLSIANINEGTNVSFSQFASPTDLPGGNTLTPPFVTTAGFSADADPGAKNGVHVGEWLEIVFALQNNQTYSSIINALNMPAGVTGSLRIGIKAQGFDPGDGSEAFVTGGGPPSVPLPASVWGGIALMGLLGAQKLRNRKA
jgi:hypothetical protein